MSDFDFAQLIASPISMAYLKHGGTTVGLRSAVAVSAVQNTISPSGKVSSETVARASILDSNSAKIQGFSDNSVSFDSQVLARLFDLKVLISQYAVHLKSKERDRLFTYLNRLVDPNAWHEYDPLPQQSSFKAFLRWALFARWTEWSGIGFSHSGNILVSWRRPNDRVTAEFLPRDEIRWTTSVLIEGRKEIAAGVCHLRRFPQAITSHLTEQWSGDHAD